MFSFAPVWSPDYVAMSQLIILIKVFVWKWEAPSNKNQITFMSRNLRIIIRELAQLCCLTCKDLWYLLSKILSLHQWAPHPFTRHRMSQFRGGAILNSLEAVQIWSENHTPIPITSERIPTKADRSFWGLDQKGHLSWMKMLSAQFVKWIEWCLSTNCSALDKPSQFTICLFLAMKSVASHDSARPERHIDERCWRVLVADSSF